MLLARPWRLHAAQAAPASTVVRAWKSRLGLRHMKTDGHAAPAARINCDVVQGVAGSGKTRYLVKAATEAIRTGQAERVLVLTKIGSNADDLRRRFAAEFGVEFKQYGKSKHHYAEVGPGSVKIWVATVDAFVDHQLRQHLSLAEELGHQAQGGNYEWKTRKLLELVGKKDYDRLVLKDGSHADFLLIDEAQDVGQDEAKVLVAFIATVPGLRALVVGDQDQTIFSDTLDHAGRGFMSLAAERSGREPIRLEANHRSPKAQVAFLNATPLLSYTVLSPPSPPGGFGADEHRPFLFGTPKGTSSNHAAHDAAKVIADMIVKLLRADPELRLDDVAVISRNVNDDRLLLQLNEELPLALESAGLVEKEKGSQSVAFMRTRGVGGRVSIDWDKTRGKITLLSIAAAKGREWPAVFLLGLTEGELPRANEIADLSATQPTDTPCPRQLERQVIARSLANVGLTRSRKYLFIHFNSNMASRYFPLDDRLREVAQLEGDRSTVHEWYLVFVRPEAPKLRKREPLQDCDTSASMIEKGTVDEKGQAPDKAGEPELVRMRKKPIRAPMVTRHRVSKISDSIQTPSMVLEKPGDLSATFKPETFGKRVKVPSSATWFTDDEVSKRLMGVVGELMLLRRLTERGLLQGEPGGAAISSTSFSPPGPAQPKVRPARTGFGAGGAEELWRNGVYLTRDTRLLNLVADTRLHAAWGGGTGEAYCDVLRSMRETLSKDPKKDRGLKADIAELMARPRCVLHARYTPVLPTLHHVLPPHQASPSVWWNAAVLYTDMFDQGTRDPSLVRRLLQPTAALPPGLGGMIEELLENADRYIDYVQKKAEEPRRFQHGLDVSLLYVERDQEELLRRNFSPKNEKDATLFTAGWSYGVLGTLDFFDPTRRRVIEVKCSQLDQSDAHEVQALFYMLLLPSGVREYEIVNLMSGKRYRRRIRSRVDKDPMLANGLERLFPGEDEMQENLLQRGRRICSRLMYAATKLQHEDTADGEKGQRRRDHI